MLAGDVAAAERELRGGYDILVQMGEKYLLSTVAGLLGQTLYALGRFDEVEELGLLSRELATDDDVDTQALWRCVLGKVQARRGAVAEGESLVREAIEILSKTDAVLLQYGARLDLAEVQRLAGGAGLEATLVEARTLAEAKESPVMASAVETELAAAAAEVS
jgi:ATP/maltotriose-dependent transcriptional regulator MalT